MKLNGQTSETPVRWRLNWNNLIVLSGMGFMTNIRE